MRREGSYIICLISGNRDEADRWAFGQLLEKDEYFYPETEIDLFSRKDFHVLVVGTAGQNVHPAVFERILNLAKSRGRMR